jgi:hypothetical protein
MYSNYITLLNTIKSTDIYLNYNQIISNVWNIHVLNNFQHFKSMKDLDAVVWVNDKNDLPNIINNLLNNPDRFAKDRKIWFDRINLNIDTPSSTIISDLLLAYIFV